MTLQWAYSHWIKIEFVICTLSHPNPSHICPRKVHHSKTWTMTRHFDVLSCEWICFEQLENLNLSIQLSINGDDEAHRPHAPTHVPVNEGNYSRWESSNETLTWNKTFAHQFVPFHLHTRYPSKI